MTFVPEHGFTQKAIQAAALSLGFSEITAGMIKEEVELVYHFNASVIPLLKAHAQTDAFKL